MIQRIAIIGGGASGALVVLTILKQATQPTSILWFDAKNNFCKGLAYSTIDKNHLLNVRASNMSVFIDEPTHFINWLLDQQLPYTKNCFVPRKIYGQYIENTLQCLLQNNQNVNVTFIPEEVIDITKDTGFSVITSNTKYSAQKVVLALGNFSPAHPRSIDTKFSNSENYFQNAFSKNVISKVITAKSITIIGSGLTMADTVLSLYHQHYTGRINVISPHGYLPQAHSELPLSPYPCFIDKDKTYRLLDLVNLVNKQLKLAKHNNIHWHSVIDSLRPHLQRLWLRFSVEDKQQFLRHLRHKWGLARHRASSESIDTITKLINSQQLIVIKGRITTITTNENSFSISYRNNEPELLHFSTNNIINCTGPESNFEKINSPLVKQLLKNKLIEVDDIKYGIKANHQGKISNGLYTLGPPLKGLLWESTAIPEIRTQAFELGKHLI